MPAPIFGPDEVDQSPNSVSLSTRPNGNGDNFWANYFSAGATGAPRTNIGLNTTNADAARTWQTQLIQDLQQQAAGNPNSKGQQALAGAYAQARQGQQALASSARGTGGGAGLRAGVEGAGEVQRTFEGDKKVLMVQEQQAAQAALAQQLAAMRGLDANQANMMAANTQQNQGLEDAMRQFYTGGGIQQGISAAQTAADRARAQAGLDLEAQEAQSEAQQRALQAGATGLGVVSRYAGSGGGGGGYRQVDGQNSIVPTWDK